MLQCILFRQSKVHEHTQLCWILTCLSTKQALSRLSQYKDKSSHLKEVPLGLFLYPVLQAADILLYKSTRVPVGEDNLQNVELSRRLARTFNNKFCERNNPLFPEPTPILVGANKSNEKTGFEGAARIRSLRDPSKKMSKSDKDPRSCIYINDPPQVILEKCKKAVTDSISAVTYDPVNRPGVSNLISIHACISRTTPEQICLDNSNIDTGAYKLLLAQALTDHFAPIRERSEYLTNNKDHLESVLRQGEDAARQIAAETMDQVSKLVGLR